MQAGCGQSFIQLRAIGAAPALDFGIFGDDAPIPAIEIMGNRRLLAL